MPTSQLAQHWPFFFDSTTTTVYRWTGKEFTLHKCITYDYDKESFQSANSLLPTAVPVFAIIQPLTISVSPNTLIPFEQPPTQATTSFSLYLAQAELWEQQLFVSMDFIQPENKVWSTISQESCLCASNGSAPQIQGAFAWVFSNRQGQ